MTVMESRVVQIGMVTMELAVLTLVESREHASRPIDSGVAEARVAEARVAEARVAEARVAEVKVAEIDGADLSLAEPRPAIMTVMKEIL
jgi:hypothetical protein